MSDDVKSIFESFKNYSKKKSEEVKVKKRVYTKNDISEILDKDTPETIEVLENIFNSSKTLINKYRKNKKNIFEEAILKKNSSVCEFIISKDYFSDFWSSSINYIVDVNFYEIFTLYSKHKRRLDSHTWHDICSNAKSSLVYEIVKNQRNILENVSENDIVSNLFLFIYTSSDSIKPLLAIQDLLTQERKNILWQNMLSCCDSVLMHQSLIDSDILPDTVVFNNKPLLLHIIDAGNIKIFDYYAQNKNLFNEAINYFEVENKDIFKIKKYTKKTELRKLLSLYEKIDLSKKDSILPDIEDFTYSYTRDIKYFIEMIVCEPLLHPYIYKKEKEEESKIYIEYLFDKLRKDMSVSEIAEFRAEIEKNYLMKSTGINKIKNQPIDNKRL